MGDLDPNGLSYTDQERASFNKALSLLTLSIIENPPKWFSLDLLSSWHGIVSYGIEQMLPGTFRTSQETRFGQFKAVEPSEVINRLRKLVVYIGEVVKILDAHILNVGFDNDGLRYLVEQSAYLHAELIAIHPFMDGNGRISRLAQTWLLAKYDIVMPEFSDKEEYLRHLNEYHLKRGHTALFQLSLRLINEASNKFGTN